MPCSGHDDGRFACKTLEDESRIFFHVKEEIGTHQFALCSNYTSTEDGWAGDVWLGAKEMKEIQDGVQRNDVDGWRVGTEVFGDYA